MNPKTIKNTNSQNHVFMKKFTFLATIIVALFSGQVLSGKQRLLPATR